MSGENNITVNVDVSRNPRQNPNHGYNKNRCNQNSWNRQPHQPKPNTPINIHVHVVNPTPQPTPAPVSKPVYKPVTTVPICRPPKQVSTFQWTFTNIHSCDYLLNRAIQAGHEACNRAPIYIGRANYGGELVPCKVIPNNRAAYVAFNGKEISIQDFELLTYSGGRPVMSWVSASNGSIPAGAVPGGHAKNNETLYIGRAHYSGSLTPGKVHASHGCLYISFGGKELPIKSYEVMVSKHGWGRC